MDKRFNAHELANDYMSGMAFIPLCKKYSVDFRTARRELVQAGVTIREQSKAKFSADEKRQALALFDSGVSIPSISKQTGMARQTVRDLVAAAGRKPRSKVDGKRRLFPLNEACFDMLTDEAAYWAGVLMADGCISAGQSVSLSFHQQDAEHLSSFKTFVGAVNHATTRGETKVCSTRFRSKRIANRLRLLGIVERKSLVAFASEKLRDNRFFWLGLIDGDGFVSRTKARPAPVVGLCGSPVLVGQFIDFASRHLGLPKRSITRHKTIGAISYHGGNAVAIIRLLWSGHDLGMPRKRALAVAHIEEFGHLKAHLIPRGTSSFRGVVRVRSRGQFTGRWLASYRQKSLGSFGTEREAAAAYTQAAFNLCSAGYSPKRSRKIIVPSDLV